MIQPFLSTFLSFGAIQAAQILLPLLALPYLARVLGLQFFGLLLYMLTVSTMVGMLLEWGFTVGSAREAVTRRNDPEALSRVLQDTLMGKALLAVCCAVLAGGMIPFLPYARANPGGYALAVCYGFARGFNPTWFFQGAGWGMRRMALWDVSGSALVLGLTFVWVREPEQWTRYLTLLLICKAASYVYLSARNGLAASASRGARELFRAGLNALYRTRLFFYGTLSSMVYSGGTVLVLGLVLLPNEMAMFLAADKITRAAVSLTGPITQTLYPEVCAAHRDVPRRARKILRLSFFWTAGLMSVAAVILAAGAPWLLRIGLGEGYADAVGALRIQSLVVPLLACNFVLGTQALIPFGQERAQTTVLVIVACGALPFAYGLGHFFGLRGASFVPVCVEGSIFIGFCRGILACCPEAFFSPRKPVRHGDPS